MRLWPRRQVFVDDLPKTHDLRFGAIFVLACCLLVGGLYAVGYLVAGDRLPAGTTVAGVDVGGMRRAEARGELQGVLARRLEHPITISAAGETVRIDPQRAGFTVDLDATIDSGLGGSGWDPRHMLQVISGGGDIAPVVDVDRTELAASLDRLSRRIDRAPVDSSVVFRQREPVVVAGQDGLALDDDDAAARLVAALVSGDDRVDLGVRSTEPDITTTEASDFVRRVADPAVHGPVRVRVADTTLILPPRQFVPALEATPRHGRLVLGIDAATLMQRTGPTLAELPRHPVDAAITFRHGHPVVLPSRRGVTVSPDNWAEVVLRATSGSGAARSVVATAVPDNPSLTTEEARMLRIRTLVSSGTVRTGTPPDPDVMRTVAAALDGTVIHPQARFSFLSEVGARDEEASSLLAGAAYQAALRAGMTDIVRSSGQYFDPASAPGLDARVARPATDLGWLNGTPYGVYVRAWVDGDARRAPVTLHVQMWSTRYWRVRLHSSPRYDVTHAQTQRRSGPGCRPRPGADGFDVDVQRVFVRDGRRQRVESAHSVYAPRQRVVCVPGVGFRP